MKCEEKRLGLLRVKVARCAQRWRIARYMFAMACCVTSQLAAVDAAGGIMYAECHHCSGTQARTIGIPVAKASVAISKPTTVVFLSAAEVESKVEDMKPVVVELCDVCNRPRDRQLRGFR